MNESLKAQNTAPRFKYEIRANYLDCNSNHMP